MQIVEQTEMHAIVTSPEPPYYRLFDKRHGSEKWQLTSEPELHKNWCYIGGFMDRDKAISVLASKEA